VLQYFQITLIELEIFEVLHVAKLKKTFSWAPLNGVAQLEVAHAFLLNTFDTYIIERLFELEGESVWVRNPNESQRDIKVVGAES